jgi:hypothetical protein
MTRHSAEYYLPHHVHLCEFDDGGVLLDLRREKYFGVNSGAMQSLTAFMRGHGNCAAAQQEDAQSTLAELEKSRLITRNRDLGRPFRPLTLACTDAVPFEGRVPGEAGIQPAQVLRFFSTGTLAALELRTRSLERIVARLRERKARHAASLHAPDAASTIGLVKIFRRLAPLLFTTREFCLRDSLMLVEFLAWHDVFPTWVIGVRTRPFGAHSWVQHDALLLNDTLQHVETFTPILAV